MPIRRQRENPLNRNTGSRDLLVLHYKAVTVNFNFKSRACIILINVSNFGRVFMVSMRTTKDCRAIRSVFRLRR